MKKLPLWVNLSPQPRSREGRLALPLQKFGLVSPVPHPDGAWLATLALAHSLLVYMLA
jgi:hypothetical protein